MKIIRGLRSVATFVGALVVSQAVSALQIIEPIEGHNSFVKISTNEITRLAIENGKIRSILVSENQLVVTTDEASGQVFIRPVVVDRPINARIVTTSGHTYSLVLQVVDIPQEDVILKDTAAAATEKLGNVDRASSTYTRALRKLITSMAADDEIVSAKAKVANQEVGLWEGTRFILRATYSEKAMTGERYQLFNVGKEQIRVVEQEFYRPGVLAVAIENMSLDPGQATSVYIVRGQ